MVSEIRRAIEVSERTRQLDVLQSTVKRVRALDQTLKEKQDSATLLMTMEGVRLVDQQIAKLYDSLDQTMSQVAQDSSVLKFNIQRPVAEVLNIHGAHRVTLGMGVRGERYINSAERVLLCAAISLRNIGLFGTSEAPDSIEQMEFKPSFRTGKQVVWLTESGRRTFTTEELIAHLIDKLIREIERQAGEVD